MLHVEHRGSGPQRVILLHGFTQSGAAWAPVVDALVDDHEVVLVDAPGHGRSAGIAADLAGTAELMVEAAGTGAWVGYSMGARMALHVALAHPAAVTRLVLVSGTGGLDHPDERAQRRRADEEIARRIEAQGVEAFVEWWLARLFATLATELAALDSRLGSTAAGLAASLRLAGTGTQQPLWDQLGAIAVPVLVVAGALDEAYLGADTGWSKPLVRARLEVIDGAGHACHLEQPTAFIAALRRFLDSPD